MSRFPIALLTSLIVVPLLGQGLAQSAPHDFLPVPPAALGPQIPEKGYLVQPIGDRLYAVLDGGYQSMFMVYDKGVVVVDAPASFGLKLLAAVREVTDKPITHLVYSHPHTDHIGAAGLLPAGVTILAQQQTADVLRRARDPKRPVPTLTFLKDLHPAPGRSGARTQIPGSQPRSRQHLHLRSEAEGADAGGHRFPGWVTFKNFSLAEDIPGFLQAHDQALAYDFTTFIGGHVNRVGTRADVLASKAYAQDVQSNAKRAFEVVDYAKAVADVPPQNVFAIYKVYLDAVAQVCTDATLATWKDRLGGADTFTFDNCWVMVESLRTDY